MENIKVFIDAGIKFDDEFKAIVERADRHEMFEYRNAIIDERTHRQNTWAGKVKNDKYRGDRSDLHLALLEVALSILGIVVAIQDFWHGGGLNIAFGVLFILYSIHCARRAAMFYLRYRGIEVEVVSAKKVKDEIARAQKEAESIKYGSLRRDSDEVLKAKQNQLDSLLGM